MSAVAQREDLGVSSLDTVDEAGFAGLAERHRRELHVHCYRMLGSFEDAEDAVQETMLRAWRRRETFEGRSTFRAWLYRIATNACLDLLERRRPKAASGGEVLWLQPYPDRLLDELVADDADEPEVVAVAQETIELAYLVAVQHLAPRPRAVLILRDVLGWPAKDVADLLGDSVNSVNSALQRARAGMREHLPAERQDWTGAEDDGTREVLRRFVDAGVATDVDGLAALLRDDVRCSMPPTPGLRVGRDAVVADWIAEGFPRCGPARRAHVGEPAAGRRLLPLARAGGRVPAADPRRAADRRRTGHGDHDLPRGPVRRPRGARAADGGRRTVAPAPARARSTTEEPPRPAPTTSGRPAPGGGRSHGPDGVTEPPPDHEGAVTVRPGVRTRSAPRRA